MKPDRLDSTRHSRACGRARPRVAASRAGLTLVEVMLAATVLIFCITAAILTLQRGMQALDTARHYTSAAQVMQMEMESLRLKSWTQVEALQASGDTPIVVTAGAMPANTAFSCVRQIRDVKTDMKMITLSATWNGYDGRPHAARIVSYYSKAGLYDYFYTSR